MKKLNDFLKERADIAEFESLKKYPDSEYNPKLSKYARTVITLHWVAAFLDDLYEVEEKGEEVLLVKKLKP